MYLNKCCVYASKSTTECVCVCVGRMGVFCHKLLVRVWSWQKKRRQCTYNVTLMHVLVPFVAVEMQ